MNRFFMTLTSLSLLVSCASLKPEPPQRRPASMSPQVTIETSGDLYPTDDGSQIQLDFFGACHTESRNIIINIKDEQASVPCENGHYKYSHHFSKTVFNSNKRKYQLSVLKAFHKGAEEKGASSWVLMDLNDKRVKTVLNRQTRYEKIPTGELEPVTEFSAFGTCTDGSKITIDVTGKDRYGHRISRYDDKKSCKNSGFYFLSQIDGLANRKMRFHIYKTAPSEKPLKRRGVASAEPTPKYRFQYSIPMYE